MGPISRSVVIYSNASEPRRLLRSGRFTFLTLVRVSSYGAKLVSQTVGARDNITLSF